MVRKDLSNSFLFVRQFNKQDSIKDEALKAQYHEIKRAFGRERGGCNRS